jgi:hypothetical protein
LLCGEKFCSLKKEKIVEVFYSAIIELLLW